ncbi:hypothetical protein I302_101580 [Kwoniella bestiolae CBS 10118]|uniref:Uncharacterized protein n=1 Tax=Kwoniella bestiolae CBS 10118 TaxID=1296100 RepID=A0A1B9GCM3_9TREE|nr:hypothetical protein I302_00263 [Kwoniella bestiolae CBS 10118]OCF28774.1 hypothetical protein I302_00263 [Kwoniella bestiolae CBS 10118]
MSNKPSYAAIVSNSSTKSNGQGSIPQSAGAGAGVGPSDAPPPYTEPHIPHQTLLPPPQQQQRQYPQDVESNQTSNGWTPPPSYAVARSRALKRFWTAFFWAWLIWIFVGLLIGGGVSDISNDRSRGHHGHWDKHGDWHDDSGRVYIASEGITSMLVRVKDKATGVLPDFS